MELIKLLQIEGISEATQEDIILNFIECIDEESALAIVEEYEQAEMSLTESIINEVSLGYALKKSLGGAVQRFKDIRKKQANVSTDRPIGLAGIRKQEAQKQDVVKSQERFKQAKDTAKDIVNRMLNTRYTRDNKVAKAPAGLKLDFEVSIGYGIGLNLDMAIKNSHTARREALLSGDSFIFTENGNLIGPLNSKACMVIENHAIYDIGKIAKNSNLSAVTIKRIISIIKVTNSNMVTTQDLSSHLKSTVRNANRILKNLEKGGYAKITCTQTSNVKGRPTKVYELNFHI